MAWVRIHDGAMTHPKILPLSDKAFRLWIWGLSYSQQHLTDGWLPFACLPDRLKRVSGELLIAQLWESDEKGYRVHDYLDWNDSRELVTKKREEARARMSKSRDRSKEVRLPPSERSSHELLRRVGVGTSGSFPEKGSGEKPSGNTVESRAGRLREELYPQWYSQHRHGARLRIIANSLEWQDAITLCQTWDDARLEKLAKIILTTDDDWISRTDRGFKIFALKATWADERLAAWEKANGVTA